MASQVARSMLGLKGVRGTLLVGGEGVSVLMHLLLFKPPCTSVTLSSSVQADEVVLATQVITCHVATCTMMQVRLVRL